MGGSLLKPRTLTILRSYEIKEAGLLMVIGAAIYTALLIFPTKSFPLTAIVYCPGVRPL